MRLFYAPQSPFARKVRAAAVVLGLDDRIALEYSEVFPGRSNSAYGDSVNPLRKIPALETEEGVLFDSGVICDYLDTLAGGGRLVPREGAARWRVLTAHALTQGMCESVILVRYETWLRPEPMRWPAWIDDQWSKILSGIAWFEGHPTELLGPINLAHLGLGCLLGYIDFRWPDHGWRQEAPRVSRWFAEIEATEPFRRTRPRSPRLGSSDQPRLILKIVAMAQWREAEETGTFVGAPVDQADGFIHFSTPAQIGETAAKHFAGQHDLLLVAVAPEPLGSALRWDVSRGGALFPHLYAPLSLDQVAWVQPLPLGAGGEHDFSGFML